MSSKLVSYISIGAAALQCQGDCQKVWGRRPMSGALLDSVFVAFIFNVMGRQLVLTTPFITRSRRGPAASQNEGLGDYSNIFIIYYQ